MSAAERKEQLERLQKSAAEITKSISDRQKRNEEKEEKSLRKWLRPKPKKRARQLFLETPTNLVKKVGDYPLGGKLVIFALTFMALSAAVTAAPVLAPVAIGAFAALAAGGFYVQHKREQKQKALEVAEEKQKTLDEKLNALEKQQQKISNLEKEIGELQKEIDGATKELDEKAKLIGLVEGLDSNENADKYLDNQDKINEINQKIEIKEKAIYDKKVELEKTEVEGDTNKEKELKRQISQLENSKAILLSDKEGLIVENKNLSEDFEKENNIRLEEVLTSKDNLENLKKEQNKLEKQKNKKADELEKKQQNLETDKKDFEEGAKEVEGLQKEVSKLTSKFGVKEDLTEEVGRVEIKNKESENAKQERNLAFPKKYKDLRIKELETLESKIVQKLGEVIDPTIISKLKNLKKEVGNDKELIEKVEDPIEFFTVASNQSSMFEREFDSIIEEGVGKSQYDIDIAKEAKTPERQHRRNSVG